MWGRRGPGWLCRASDSRPVRASAPRPHAGPGRLAFCVAATRAAGGPEADAAHGAAAGLCSRTPARLGVAKAGAPSTR